MGIAAIIGGHSHTLLSNTVDGAPAYATLVENPSGKAVPIVQAYAYSKYLGEIALTFDEDGYVAAATGNTVRDNFIGTDITGTQAQRLTDPLVWRYAIDDTKTTRALGFALEHADFKASLEATVKWYLEKFR